MNITLVKPRGYCHGVVTAVQTILSLIDSDTPKPIHIYGMLIHNKHVVEAFRALGVISHIDPDPSLLDDITGTVVFTAHGIRQSVIARAKHNNLTIVNTVCRDVTSTIDLINESVQDGYEVLYVGKKGHPEATASTEHVGVHLIQTKEDLLKYDTSKHYKMTNQTTLSMLSLRDIYDSAMERFEHIEILEELCSATKSRQLAVLEQSDKDMLIVVGDKRSNNSNNLAKLHHNGILVESYKDLIGRTFHEENIAVTAGASTPSNVVKQVITYLEGMNTNQKPNIPELSPMEVLALK